MPISREPYINPVPLADLRPTQITVGMREVQAKREAWRKQKDQGAYLGKHMLPAIVGPKKRHYIIDHHHMARALMEEGVEEVEVTVVADLGKLEKDSFFFVLDNHSWMHPFDAKGERRPYSDIPKSVGELVDDPYRSLAGELRRMGGYAKDTTPFSEFLWADFLRHHIDRRDVDKDFAGALAAAMRLAKDSRADYLPGWCGPIAKD